MHELARTYSAGIRRKGGASATNTSLQIKSLSCVNQVEEDALGAICFNFAAFSFSFLPIFSLVSMEMPTPCG